MRMVWVFTWPLFMASCICGGEFSNTVDLGIPVNTPNRISYKAAYQFGPGKQNLLVWTTTAESGGSFCAMDLRTEQVWVHPLNSLEAYPIVFASNGRVYAGSTSGEVMYWDPSSDDWGPLGKPLFKRPGASINHVRVLCEGRDGWLYAGSCYGERARISLNTGRQEPLPDVPEQGEWYVSAAAALPDGKIAFGFGHKARVYIYDPAQQRDIAQVFPPSWQQDGFCFNLVVGKNILYATHFPSGRRGIIDIHSLRFSGEIPWPADTRENAWSRWTHSSGHGSAVDFYNLPGTNAVLASDGDTVYRFDPSDSPASTTMPLSQFRPDSALALALQYEVTADCRILKYDDARLRVMRQWQPDMPPAERMVFSLGLGPDGNIYGGAYQSTLLFRHDLQTGKTNILGDHHPDWHGETFSYVIRNEELICASYTNGAVVSYTPDRPWECERNTMVNPRRIGFLGQQLYRPYAMCTTADGSIWAAGPAGWGSTGGGLGRILPHSDAIKVMPLTFLPHSVLPIDHDRLLLGSDSLLVIWGVQANRELVRISLEFTCVDVCLADSDSSRVAVLTDDGQVILMKSGTDVPFMEEKRIQLPATASRILSDGERLVAGGAEGFMVVDLKTGQAYRFCDRPLGSRWAFTVTRKATYFGSGTHLFKCEVPE